MSKACGPQEMALFEQTLSLLRGLYWEVSSFRDVETREPGSPAADAPEPIGDPKDQCWKYTLRSDKIKVAHVAELANTTECVFLQSAALDDGVAVFVICCKKEKGKCKDCRASPQLQVKNGNDFIVTKNVSMTCRPGE